MPGQLFKFTFSTREFDERFSLEMGVTPHFQTPLSTPVRLK